MPAPDHVYEIFIRATPDEVWTAITDPDWTRRYFFQTAIETSLEPGSGYRYLLPNGDPAADGELEVVEPGRRLVLTWRALYDAALADEPPGRVEWLLSSANDAGSVTRLRVRHYDLGLSPATWANVEHGWVAILDGLKTVLETGDELGTVELSDPTPVDDVTRAWHRGLAVTANNSTWELLDGRAFDPDTAFDLLGRAYAAAHHWRAATGRTSINSARAAWLCSRAHAVLGDGGPALRMAEHCERLTAEAGDDAVDFDRVYAVEAKARALACLGRLGEAAPLRQAAIDAVAQIADEEDRKILEGDVEAPPWFDL